MRRSRILFGMAILALLALHGAVVQSTPRRAGAPAQDTVPVVLLHGWCSDPSEAFGTPGSGSSFGDLLQQEGFMVALANYSERPCLAPECIDAAPCSGCDMQPIAQLAGRLADQIEAVRERLRVSQVDIVCHSMGGLIARAYIAGLARKGDATVPYRSDIRKLVMAGTPNFGSVEAGFAVLPPGCSKAHASELRIGSKFIWELQQDWASQSPANDVLVIAGTRGRILLGSNVTDDHDGVVSIYSAALAESPDERIRYVPYRHSKAVPFPEGAPSLVRTDGPQHATFRLATAFLKTGAVLPQCCGEGTVDYQPQPEALARAMVIVQVIEEDGEPAPRLFGTSLRFDPTAQWDARADNDQNGSIALIGFRPNGVYMLTAEDFFRRGSAAGVPVESARTTLSVVQVFPR
ncbi:MAG: hypothetical protein HY650_13855 [Acidobacteria bacterium]|nr:hypothetical protein [Acidobacteriota bacterium]